MLSLSSDCVCRAWEEAEYDVWDVVVESRRSGVVESSTKRVSALDKVLPSWLTSRVASGGKSARMAVACCYQTLATGD